MKMPKRKHSAAEFPHAYAVILAGGSGTRFWPLSRRARPKQLLKVFGKESLLFQTAERLRGIIPPERTYVLTSKLVRGAVAAELPRIPARQIIAEPASRNTAPAIGLAAWEILRQDPEGLMVVLPSDHVITMPKLFQQALAAACRVASVGSRSVVMGLKPTRPETGFGYIQLGKSESTGRGPRIFSVLRFTEKPSRQAAARYVRSGKYLWNGGMFIWKASTFLANLKQFQPAMAAELESIARAGGIRSRAALDRIYPRLENISVDYALMEKISNVYAVAAQIGWSDVGSWEAAWELIPKRGSENVCPSSSVMLNSHRNLVISSTGKFVAAVGIEDLVIVETADALLVCQRNRSQDVGALVKELARTGRQELL